MDRDTGFQLRVGTTEVRLSDGDFSIGRSSACDLILDGHLVSRRHCVLRVTERGVMVRDLGSRNGVLVNSHRIDEVAWLQHGDQLNVGSYAMSIVFRSAEQRPDRPTESHDRDHALRERAVTKAHPRIPEGSPPPAGQASVPAGPGLTPQAAAPSPAPVRGIETQKGSVFEMFLGALERALGDGRATEADRVAGNLIVSLRASLLRGQIIEPSVLEAASVCVLRLIELTGRRSWFDRLFELNQAAGRVMGKPSLDLLEGLAAKGVAPDPASLAAYVAVVRERAVSLDALDRRGLRRLTALAAG